MKLKVNPMVLAAALGLLGPAALADDDDDAVMPIAGQWARAAKAPAAPQGSLEPTIELIPIEGRLLLGEGSKESWVVSSANDRWSQELALDGARISRSFQLDGDALMVETTVISDGVSSTTVDTYGRVG